MSTPSRRFVSSVTGTWITSAQATDPAYWASQCRLPVRFGAALASLAAEAFDTLLEVGPGETLTALALSIRNQALRCHRILWSPRVRQDRPARARRTLEDRHHPQLAGLLRGRAARRISPPTYPFERKLHWIAPPARTSSSVL